MNEQFNVRLPQMTLDQIDRLCAKLGTTKVQLVILAIDRLERDTKGIMQFRPEKDAAILKAQQ